jgi:CubicO group peptidase (beta-lactamase class C family)
MESPVQGSCDPRFGAVREAFEENFRAGREVGASFAATLDGRFVVDLWGGHADSARQRPWQRDTLANVFSTTKAVVALAAHALIESGLMDVGAPVSRYWPEFARAGKEGVTLRHLLCHQAGLAAVRAPLPSEALYDWDRLVAVLADERPWWEPGSASGYHALTFGHLVGELVRRVTGRSPGAFVREAVAGPLDADFHIGLAAAEDARVAEMVPRTPEEMKALGPTPASDPESLLAKVMGNPAIAPEMANRRAWRAAEIPAANGHGNARSVARIMALLACGGALDGVTLLGAETLARATAEQWHGTDLVLGIPMRWGLGFMLTSDTLPLGPNPRSFGHGGWGGSLGIADLDARVSYAYVMNRMSPGTTGDSRPAGMVAALYAAL